MTGTKWSSLLRGAYFQSDQYLELAKNGSCNLRYETSTEYGKEYLEAVGKCSFDQKSGILNLRLNSLISGREGSDSSRECFGASAKARKCRKATGIEAKFDCQLGAAQVYDAEHRLHCKMPQVLSGKFGKEANLFLKDETPNLLRKIRLGNNQVIQVITVFQYMAISKSEALYAYQYPDVEAQRVPVCIYSYDCFDRVGPNESAYVVATAVVGDQKWLLVRSFVLGDRSLADWNASGREPTQGEVWDVIWILTQESER